MSNGIRTASVWHFRCKNPHKILLCVNSVVHFQTKPRKETEVWSHHTPARGLLFMGNHPIRNLTSAVAVWLRWLDCCPIHQKVAGSVPRQGAKPGCRFNPQQGCMWEPLIDVSLSLIHINVSLSISNINF